MESKITCDGITNIGRPVESTGCITFGPAQKCLAYIPVYYTPTEEQVKNLRDYFGWDYVPKDKQKEVLGF